MHILVSGATGFIGRHLVNKALERGHIVTAIVRDTNKARKIFCDVDGLNFLHAKSLESIEVKENKYDALINLAWDGTTKYTMPENIFENLQPQFTFLNKAVQAGIKNIVVAGTCYEYGLCEGVIKEDDPINPVTYYGVAKVALHDSLKILLKDYSDVNLKWLRYFYAYGEDRKKSLLGQLITAIENDDQSFNMSSGEQTRDFIHVSTLTHNTLIITENVELEGVYNIGNGKPVKVIDWVKRICTMKNSNIKLNVGHYQIPSHEPLNFYADVEKIKKIKGIKLDDELYM